MRATFACFYIIEVIGQVCLHLSVEMAALLCSFRGFRDHVPVLRVVGKSSVATLGKVCKHVLNLGVGASEMEGAQGGDGLGDQDGPFPHRQGALLQVRIKTSQVGTICNFSQT